MSVGCVSRVAAIAATVPDEKLIAACGAPCCSAKVLSDTPLSSHQCTPRQSLGRAITKPMKLRNVVGNVSAGAMSWALTQDDTSVRQVGGLISTTHTASPVGGALSGMCRTGSRRQSREHW